MPIEFSSALTHASRSDRLCAGGHACLFAIARPARRSHPADFLFVVQRRSRRVLNGASALSVLPKSFHQHTVSASDEVHLGTTVYRELEEELFGRQEFEEGGDSGGRGPLGLNPYHADRLTAPMRWLVEHGACTVECVGAGLNLINGNYEFATLVTVHDEEFWARFSGACLPNWEAADVQTYSTAESDQLQELMADERWTNEGLFALIEGLLRLAELWPDRVQLPHMEVVT